MKLLQEKTYYLLFEASLIFKAAYSIVEVILGFLFIFFDYQTLYGIAVSLTGDELSPGQTGPVWTYVIHAMKDFATTPREFWAFLFISHGVVKLFLIWGLLRQKLWSYPASAVVFVLFIISQLYQIWYTPSLVLWFITIFDVVVVVLIIHEYKRKKKHLSVTH